MSFGSTAEKLLGHGHDQSHGMAMTFCGYRGIVVRNPSWRASS
jgi:hypothetical protein